MVRRPPISTRTDTLCPYTTLFRSDLGRRPAVADPMRFHDEAVPARLPVEVDGVAVRREGQAIHFPSIFRMRAARSASSLRSEEHTSELQSLMRISSAVFCLKQKKYNTHTLNTTTHQHHVNNP